MVWQGGVAQKSRLWFEVTTAVLEKASTWAVAITFYTRKHGHWVDEREG